MKDYQKSHEENKLADTEFEAIRSKVEVISYATMAEINHFQSEKIHDFNQIMANYLQEQIRFYQGVSEQFCANYKAFISFLSKYLMHVISNR